MPLFRPMPFPQQKRQRGIAAIVKASVSDAQTNTKGDKNKSELNIKSHGRGAFSASDAPRENM